MSINKISSLLRKYEQPETAIKNVEINNGEIIGYGVERVAVNYHGSGDP